MSTYSVSSAVRLNDLPPFYFIFYVKVIVKDNWQAGSTERNPSWGVNSHSPSQEILHLSRGPKVCCRVHKRLHTFETLCNIPYQAAFYGEGLLALGHLKNYVTTCIFQISLATLAPVSSSSGCNMKLTTHAHRVQKLRMRGVISPLFHKS
jgi:hypothetical protein